jgi:hypothetical protein
LLIKIFPTTPKAHSNSSEIFSYTFNLIFSEEIIQDSRTFCTTSRNIMEPKPMHPSLSRAFQRLQEHNLKHPGAVDLITTKQNKTNYLPS